MCDHCIYYSLYLMITGRESYAYNGDIPCLRCCHYIKLQSEFIDKNVITNGYKLNWEY